MATRSLLFAAGVEYSRSPERLVEFDLEQVPGAQKYEVKFSSLSNPKREALAFQIEKTHFSQRIPLDRWHIEIRSYDGRGIPGRWTDLSDVDLQFKAPTIKFPKIKEKVQAPTAAEVPVKFLWLAFSKFAKFKITIKSMDDSSKSIEKVVVGDQIEIPLKAGTYSWSLTSLPPAGIGVDGKDPDVTEFQVTRGKLATPSVPKQNISEKKMISWNKVSAAELYDLELFERLQSDGANDVTEVKEKKLFSGSLTTNEYELPSTLTPGQYRITLTAKARGFDHSAVKTISFQIKKTEEKKEEPKELTKQAPAVVPVVPPPKHVPVNFVQGSMGPVIWTYNFRSSEGQNLNLTAGTVTAVAADFCKWFDKSAFSAWAIDVRGRQTNIYLFDNGTSQTPGQGKVVVADRRIAIVGRRREIKDRVGLDLILGVGNHHYTYLTQVDSSSIVKPSEGQLFEYYLGGAIDWQLPSGSHTSLDLTFHPVGASAGLSPSQTSQYTVTLKYLMPIVTDRSFFSLQFENFRSRVDVTSSSFSGVGHTTSVWYRAAGGVAVKF